MKKNKRLITLLIILLILVVIAIIVNITLADKPISYNFIKEKNWIIENTNQTETLVLKDNNEFSYYDSTTNERIQGFENCTTYELTDKIIKLNCGKEINIVNAGDKNLYLKVDGKVKKFTKKASNTYKIFDIGYHTDVNTPYLATTYEKFIDYINKYKSSHYDENGNPTQSSSDQIKVQYDKTYFDTNNLGIYYVQTNSGSIRIKDVNTTVKDGILEITYEKEIPEVGTMDMSGYLIFVEVDKKVTGIK